MTLGAFTLIDEANEAQGPVFFDRCTLVGDNAYATGGTTGLQALYQAAVKSHRTIMAIIPQFCGDAVPSYDPVTDKLLVQVMSTAAQAGNGVDLSASTYKFTIISK
jgi:hypothetical protein